MTLGSATLPRFRERRPAAPAARTCLRRERDDADWAWRSARPVPEGRTLWLGRLSRPRARGTAYPWRIPKVRTRKFYLKRSIIVAITRALGVAQRGHR